MQLNDNYITVKHNQPALKAGELAIEGDFSILAPPFTLVRKGNDLIPLEELSDVETYTGWRVNEEGKSEYHYVTKSHRIIRDEDLNETILPIWEEGDETNHGKILTLGDEIALIEKNGVIGHIKKSLLMPSPVDGITEFRRYKEAAEKAYSLKNTINKKTDDVKIERIQKSFFKAFKENILGKFKTPQAEEPEAETKPPVQDAMKSAGSDINKDIKQNYQYIGSKLNLDTESPTRLSHQFKDTSGNTVESPNFLDEKGNSTEIPNHLQNHVFQSTLIPGMTVKNSKLPGKALKVHQIGNTKVALQDENGNINAYDKSDIEEHPENKLNPLTSPLTYKAKKINPEMNQLNFNKYNIQSEPAFAQNLAKGDIVKLPSTHPGYQQYKERNNTDYASVVIPPNEKGKMLVSSPLNRTGYNYHTVDTSLYPKQLAQQQKQETETGAATTASPPTDFETLQNKVESGGMNPEIADQLNTKRTELEKKRDEIKGSIGMFRNQDDIKNSMNEMAAITKQIEYINSLGKPPREENAKPEEQILPSIQKDSDEYHNYQNQIGQIKQNGLRQVEHGTQFSKKFEHPLFDFSLEQHPNTGAIKGEIKNARTFSYINPENKKKTTGRVMNYNPETNEVAIEGTKGHYNYQIMPLDELMKAQTEKLPGMSEWAENANEFNKPVTSQTKDFGKGSLQHEEFEEGAGNMKNNKNWKHSALESNADKFNHVFYHKNFGKMELRYNPATGQKMGVFSNPQSVRFSNKEFVPETFNPKTNEVTFYRKGFKSDTSKGSRVVRDADQVLEDINATPQKTEAEKKTKVPVANGDKEKFNSQSQFIKNNLFSDILSKHPNPDASDIEHYLKNEHDPEDFKSQMVDIYKHQKTDAPPENVDEFLKKQGIHSHEELLNALQTEKGGRQARAEIEAQKEKEKGISEKQKKEAQEKSSEFKQHKEYLKNYNKLSDLESKGHKVGKQTSLVIPNNEMNGTKAKFMVGELGDLSTSHIPAFGKKSFEKNPVYPEGIQPKAYDEKSAQAEGYTGKVNEIAGNKYNPKLIVNPGVQANDNTPIVDKKGLVLGGNSRGMGMKLHDKENIEKTRSEILNNLDNFFDIKNDKERKDLTKYVKGLKSPIAYRQLDYNMGANTENPMEDVSKYKKMASVLNQSQQAVVSGADKQRANIQLLGEHIPAIAQTIGDKDINRLNSSDVKQIDSQLANKMTKDQRAEYINGDYLTDEGKVFLKKVLSSNAIDNPKTRTALEKNPIGQKIMNNISSADKWNSIKNLTSTDKTYSLQRDFDKTIGYIKGEKDEDKMGKSMFGKPLRQRVLFDVLTDKSGDKLRNFTEEYHNFVQNRLKESGPEAPESMFAMGTPNDLIDSFYKNYEKKYLTPLQTKKELPPTGDAQIDASKNIKKKEKKVNKKEGK